MTTMSLVQYAQRMGVRAPYISQLKRDGKLVIAEDGRVDVEATDRSLAASIDWPLEISRGPGKIAKALHRLGVVEGHLALGAVPIGQAMAEAAAVPIGPAVAAAAPVQTPAPAPSAPARPEFAPAAEQPVVLPVAAMMPVHGSATAVDGPLFASTGPVGREMAEVGELTQARIMREQAAAQTAQLQLRKLLGELVAVAEVERELGAMLRGVRESLLQLTDRLAPLLAAEYDEARIRVLLRAEIRAALNELANRARTQADVADAANGAAVAPGVVGVADGERESAAA